MGTVQAATTQVSNSHLWIQEGHWLISEQSIFSKSVNKQPRWVIFKTSAIIDHPEIFNWSTLYIIISIIPFIRWLTHVYSFAFWGSRNRPKNQVATYNCAQHNYFLFVAVILETDCNWLGQSQTVGIHPEHVGHMGNRAENNFWWLYLESTAVALQIWNTTR